MSESNQSLSRSDESMTPQKALQRALEFFDQRNSKNGLWEYEDSAR